MILSIKPNARTSNFKIPNSKSLGYWDFGFALDFEVCLPQAGILKFGL
jgi:hypothetical protein